MFLPQPKTKRRERVADVTETQGDTSQSYSSTLTQDGSKLKHNDGTFISKVNIVFYSIRP